MQDIRRVLRAAARRLLVVGIINSVVWTLSIAMAALVVLIMIDRALVLSLPWMTIFLGSLGAAVVAGVAWAIIARKREDAVARVVDERAGLRESLSTALCVERSEDPWSRAVVESAVEKSRRVVVKDAIPIEGPRSWPVPTISAAVLALTFFLMPTLDVRGALAEAKAAEETRRELEEARAQELETDQLIREILAERDMKLGEEEPDPELAADLAKPESPENVRKQAIKKLTSVAEELAKKQESDEARALQAVKDLMKQLRSPGEGALTEFARELARGNFEKAQQSLDEIAKQLSSGELDAGQKEQLKQQMENLAKQMESLAQQRGELEQQLRQAGLNPEQAKQAAQSAEAMQQALQNNQNLTEEQKQQLQQAAQAMQQAASQSQTMGQAMAQMAQGMSQSGMSQQGQQGMDSMSGQLSSMEMMQADMQSISDQMNQLQAQMAKLGECNGAQGWCQGNTPGQGMTGQWKPGSSLSQGAGSGGPGKGNGAGPEAEDAEFTMRREKANVNNQGGPIIGSRYVFGEQIKGEARAEFEAQVAIAADAAAEDIKTMNVPPELRGSVQHYFGRLQERVKAQRGESGGESTGETADDPGGDD